MGAVEEFLKDFPIPAQEYAQILRAIIKNAIPEATEKVYYGWRGIGFRHPRAGYFCCIFPFPTLVKLAFEHGALLPDPDGLLELPPTGTKQLRYLTFALADTIPEDEIVGFLHAAISLKT